MTNPSRSNHSPEHEAAVHWALDALPESEREALEREMETNADLRKFVGEYRNCIGDLSLAAPQEDPPADMLQKIRARIDDAEMAWQRSEEHPPAKRISLLWWGWPVAACFAALAGFLLLSRPGDSPSNASASAGGTASERETTVPRSSDGGRHASTTPHAGPTAGENDAEVRKEGKRGHRVGDIETRTVYQLRQDIGELEQQLRQLRRLHDDRFEHVPGRARLLVVEMQGPAGEQPAEEETDFPDASSDDGPPDAVASDSTPKPAAPDAESISEPGPLTSDPVAVSASEGGLDRDYPIMIAGILNGLQNSLFAQNGVSLSASPAAGLQVTGLPEGAIRQPVEFHPTSSSPPAHQAEEAIGVPVRPTEIPSETPMPEPAPTAAPPAGYTVFDETSGEGSIIVQNLAPPSEGSDYQLWVVDPRSEAPISVGLLPAIENGAGRIDFNGLGSVPSRFFVTEEPVDGSETPTGSIVISGPPAQTP